jgi:hypothetical protein
MVNQGSCAGWSRVSDVSEHEVELPLIVLPRAAASLQDQAGALQSCVARYLPRMGVIVFRGFPVRDRHQFETFVAISSNSPHTPRARSVPFARPAEPDRAIPVHPTAQRGLVRRNASRAVAALQAERWYCRRHPERIWLHCVRRGPFVSVADAREVCAALPSELRERWSQHGVQLARSYPAFGGSSWQSIFGTDDPRSVEAWCRAEGFTWEWQSQQRLRIQKVCPAVTKHEKSGASAWFNAAHALLSPSREGHGAERALEVLAGTGERLAEADVLAISRAFESAKLVVPCEPGDVVLLDNVLTAHAAECWPASEPPVHVLRQYATGFEAPGIDPIAERHR